MKRKTKNLIYWGSGILFVIGIAFLVFSGEESGDSFSSVYSASALTAAEQSFDFNRISMKDGNVSHEFEIKNEGLESVKIEKIYTSCMCTTVWIIDSAGKRYGKFGMPGHNLPSKTDIEIEPGESAIVEAVFDPTAHGPSGVGLAQRSIYIETNSARSPKLELSFQVMVAR